MGNNQSCHYNLKSLYYFLLKKKKLKKLLPFVEKPDTPHTFKLTQKEYEEYVCEPQLTDFFVKQDFIVTIHFLNNKQEVESRKERIPLWVLKSQSYFPNKKLDEFYDFEKMSEITDVKLKQYANLFYEHSFQQNLSKENFYYKLLINVFERNEDDLNSGYEHYKNYLKSSRFEDPDEENDAYVRSLNLTWRDGAPFATLYKGVHYKRGEEPEEYLNAKKEYTKFKDLYVRPPELYERKIKKYSWNIDYFNSDSRVNNRVPLLEGV
jgi:hypothetical protein